MKPSQSYFVFNKESDYRRGWGENLRLTGSGIRAERTDRPCVFWSRLLDCREKETVWHRMYTAPNTMGVYEVVAESEAHPELRASTYVVVRGPQQA